MCNIDVYAQLGDLKEVDYRNTLAIATLIEILHEKGLITRREFSQKAQQLDAMTIEELKILRTR
ncbi:hypothetical protein HNQ80_004582 [Anaerosolibacter carboniphilus]|uniref:Uncharacterized protein n=1 Tax=Anaerosolibacter carboniphilus TaxID=1417629 RepID=A0A841L1D3_9FIRM|nr:hypothetical protein [Anaerosolibacter carboniphilus]MBB6218418.1 hypothetical protein [Anaerosolibacter carboniphilus]